VSIAELTRWIAGQSWIAYQQGSPTLAYAAVRAAILGCIEDGEDLYFDPGRGEVIVKIASQGAQPFNNLSDGQRTMLALVGDLAQRAFTLNPGLEDRALTETPGVVLIDELDLHLHPIWQRRVIEDLRRTFPKMQFFATTHSPFLIQSLRSGEELTLLNGLPTAQLGNKTLTEIAQGIMGVPSPSVSERYGEMKYTARHFLETLERAALSPKAKLKALEKELAKSTAPYADNPAYQAFLEMKLAAKLG
jgi:predicted ATP-binding protein involved in virulence